MGTNHVRSGFLYLFSISCIFLCLNNAVYSQVTIKEKIELGGEEPKIQVQSAAIPFLANENAVIGNTIEFTAQEDGQVAIVFENGIKFSSPFSNRLKISVTDTSGNLKYENNFSPGDYFTNSAQGQMTPDCNEDWYLYGNGPFVWNSGTTDDAIDDSWVFSLGCNQDYAQETGRCQTSNFGDNGDLNAWAWTWSGDFAVIRSFFAFQWIKLFRPSSIAKCYFNVSSR